mgnify:CR=1 FL=1
MLRALPLGGFSARRQRPATFSGIDFPMGKRYDELLGQQLIKDNGQFVHGFLSGLFAADNGGHGVGQFVVHLAPAATVGRALAV